MVSQGSEVPVSKSQHKEHIKCWVTQLQLSPVGQVISIGMGQRYP